MNAVKSVKVIFFLLLTAAFGACKSQKIPSDSLVISLEKTPCFGACEAYKLEIFASGVVKLNGISNFEKSGKHRSQLDKLALADIKAKFRNADFFSFKNEYTSKMSDLPTTYLYFKDGSREKMIQDYYGAPPRLKELEKIVEDLVAVLNWKKDD